MQRLTCLMMTLVAIALTGCASHYVTPGGRADFRAFGLSAEEMNANTDASIRQALDRKPLSPFPARLAIARVQAANYSSRWERGTGHGAYSVVAQRTVEDSDHLRRIENLPLIDGVAMFNSLLVPARLNSDREMREAAAALHADLLLLYTFDTRFEIDNTAIAPLGTFTLGIFPTRNARVNTTASALLMDVRSGYIYALAESSADDEQLANHWTDDEAVEQVRQRVEREAFDTLISDFTRAWGEVVNQYALSRR